MTRGEARAAVRHLSRLKLLVLRKIWADAPSLAGNFGVFPAKPTRLVPSRLSQVQALEAAMRRRDWRRGAVRDSPYGAH
jgi:hypothetical protein